MKNSDFLVFGADGMQGQIVTKYLLKKGYRLLLSDLYKTNVRKMVKKHGKGQTKFIRNDLRDVNATNRLLKDIKSEIVINCADMYWNMNVYLACLKQKRHCVDLGSWIELTRQQLGMHKKFEKIHKTAITGCGSVPGIGNVMLNYASKDFDLIHSVDVGFSWNSNQKKFVVPFSMKAILEELTYNPKFIRNGNWLEKPPLAVSLRRKFRLVGYQRCYMVQHPEIYTFYHYFKNRGLKNVRFFAGFPEHSLTKIRSLIELGFHSDKPVKIEEIGAKIAPFDLLNPVLKRLRVPKGYNESENLWVKIHGKKNNHNRTVLMETLVPPIRGWENSGCNVDTGFPASIIAEMIKDGRIATRGSFAPEAVVPVKPFFAELKKLGFSTYKNGKEIVYN